MNITLENGKTLRGDIVVSAVVRSDLSPIPRTLEATVRLDDDVKPFLVEGKRVIAGHGDAEFRIVKVETANDAQSVQGGRAGGNIAISALLDPCHAISFRRQKAVIKESASMGAIYRSCGATVSVESDFTIPRFSCLAGEVPSIMVARVLQEEGGALLWVGGAKLRFVRLPDLFKQTPADRVSGDSARDIESGFLERHEVPSFYSIGPDGGFVFGNREKTRTLHYRPRADVRTLRNMTRVLVMRKTLRGQYAGQIGAGAVIEVDGKAFVVVTAAHVHESGTDGEGADGYSKYWLGSLEE